MSKRNIPLTKVEDPSFRDFLLTLNPNLRCVSRNTTKSDTRSMYERFKLGICKIFEQHVNGFCVSVDGWTSESQNKNCIGTFVSFILDWERKTCLLSLQENDCGSQTADVIAHAIYDELRSFNIQSKLFAMVSGNRSNVVAAWPILINLLAKDGIYVDEHMHARCVCHVVNILVRQFLKDLGANFCLSQAVADNDVCSHAHAVNIVRFMTSFVHSSPKRLNKVKAQQSLAGQHYVVSSYDFMIFHKINGQKARFETGNSPFLTEWVIPWPNGVSLTGDYAFGPPVSNKFQNGMGDGA
jgi:hypothetical protein